MTIAAGVMKRRASKIQATPIWFNKFEVDEIYNKAKQLTAITGISYHVDHIIPLHSKIVCGLHCTSNLRVIPAHENIAKGNRYWEDMP